MKTKEWPLYITQGCLLVMSIWGQISGNLLCPSISSCIKGRCNAAQDKCDCDRYFLGKSCKWLDLTVAVTSIGSRTAVFIWRSPVAQLDISDFVLMHRRKEFNSVIQQVNIEPYRSGIILKKLKSSSDYIVCAVHQNYTSDVQLDLLSNSSLDTGCVEIKTAYDNSEALKLAAILVGCFMILSLIVLFIARAVYLYKHRRILTLTNMPKISEDDDSEEAVFDFLDGTLNMESSRDRIIIKTVSRSTTKSEGVGDIIRVEFFSSRDRDEVYRMAKLQKQLLSISKGRIELKHLDSQMSNSLPIGERSNSIVIEPPGHLTI